MKSELEQIASEVATIANDNYEGILTGAKLVLEFARKVSYPIDPFGHLRVSLEDLEEFVEGEKNV